MTRDLWAVPGTKSEIYPPPCKVFPCRRSDYLPKRFTHEPSTMPGSEGHVCELEIVA